MKLGVKTIHHRTGAPVITHHLFYLKLLVVNPLV